MRVLRKNIWNACASLVMGIFMAGCSMGSGGDASMAPGTTPAITVAPAPSEGIDHLQTDPFRKSDRVKIEFSGAPDIIPPVETEIKDDGSIHLDLVGNVIAEGKTPGQLERDIQAKYVPQYYTHLNVTVTPSARFFYVQGEVNGGATGGRLIYSGPITVTRAIAAAGDFNSFANRKKVKLFRVDGKTITVNCLKVLDHPELDPFVYPGDKIFVPLRRW